MGEVRVVPKRGQQRHIGVARETTGGRSWEQELLVLIHRLKLDKTVIRKLRETGERVHVRQVISTVFKLLNVRRMEHNISKHCL